MVHMAVGDSTDKRTEPHSQYEGTKQHIYIERDIKKKIGLGGVNI